MKWLKSITIGILISLLLVACGSTPTEEPTEVVLPSETPIPATSTPTATPIPPTPTETIQPSPTETFTPTPHPIATMSAVVNVASLNLRAGPSTIYAVIGAYPEGTELVVLARVPGNEWVRVQMPDEVTGWMSVGLLDFGGEVEYLPLEQVTESIVISGRVIDSDAQPINGVDVAVLQRLTDVNLRTDAVTGDDGYFYAYIPKQSAGIWEAQIVGVLCDSIIMDENCNIVGHFLYNFRVIFEPPPLSPIVFMYQVADKMITGTLTDAQDEPVSMRVFAEREDGAYSYTQSGEDGTFSLPVGEGIWSVYSIQYNPNLEGDPVIVEVVPGEDPEPISVKAPVVEGEQ